MWLLITFVCIITLLLHELTVHHYWQCLQCLSSQRKPDKYLGHFFAFCFPKMALIYLVEARLPRNHLRLLVLKFVLRVSRSCHHGRSSWRGRLSPKTRWRRARRQRRRLHGGGLRSRGRHHSQRQLSIHVQVRGRSLAIALNYLFTSQFIALLLTTKCSTHWLNHRFVHGLIDQLIRFLICD